ncbi:MAG: TROVE domain-containing protein [Elusimicrobia bacterium]|nr:TROVE domain-containing protein [Elusimicrobiota bacterium]
MGKLRDLFGRKSAYDGATKVNFEGAPAFERSLEERVIQVLMTGNLEDTFYASAKSLAQEAVKTLDEQGAVDPSFLAKAVVYAREQGYLRLAPITGLLVLSKHDPALLKAAFPRVIRTLGDLQDFLTLTRSKAVRSTGRSIREAAGRWLRDMEPYQVIKYGAAGASTGPNSPVNLRDILRLTHPKPGPATHLFRYAIDRVRGEKPSEELLAKLPEQIRAYERFKALTVNPEVARTNAVEALALVQRHSLPYEVVTARLASSEAWKALASRAPFMNMLRNLNNYQKHGVFGDPELKARVIARLTDPEQIRKSMQLPLRFFSAYRTFQGDEEVREALAAALELSVANFPDLGRTLVAVDESGSMASPLSAHSSLMLYDVGNVFAAACWKKSSGGWLVPFCEKAMPVGAGGPQVNRGDSIATIASGLYLGGGTDLSAPLDWALDGKKKFDTGVFITDNESWVDHLKKNAGVVDSIRRFRGRNPKARFFFIQLAPYQDAQAPMSEPGVHFVYGWSDQALRFIAQVASGGATQLDEVKATRLDGVEGAVEPEDE